MNTPSDHSTSNCTEHETTPVSKQKPQSEPTHQSQSDSTVEQPPLKDCCTSLSYRAMTDDEASVGGDFQLDQIPLIEEHDVRRLSLPIAALRDDDEDDSNERLVGLQFCSQATLDWDELSVDDDDDYEDDGDDDDNDESSTHSKKLLEKSPSSTTSMLHLLRRTCPPRPTR